MSAVTETQTNLPVELPPAAGTVIEIEPSHGWVDLKLRELWQYRELLFFLTWRDVKVRYKQTALGAAWAILQPFMTMVVFSLFFGKLAKMPSDGVPYPIFSYVGLVPWTFFAAGLTNTSNSLVGSSNLIKKVYFPRLAIPISTIFSGLVDFFLAFVVLLGMMGFFRVWPTPKLLFLPLFLLLAISTSLGVGLWLSALNVRYRDVKYIVPFLTQFWMIASPIAYSSSLVPEKWRLLYALNPMAGVIEGFRWAMLDTQFAPGPVVAVSTLVALILLLSGALYFRRMERTFADVV
ncbi:MAG: ABC transporter permease [Armatimonadota bacterium]